MTWHPHAVHRPINRYRPGQHSAMTVHNRVILHTAVSGADSLYPMMSVSGTATSHFYVRSNGVIEQYVSTSVQSSANLEGNYDGISVETEDNYPHGWHGGNAPKWTDAQLDSLASICAWAHRVHGVPLRRLKSSRRGTRGIGIHRQGCDGNFAGGIFRGRVSGGEHWSYSFGKTCPTDTRIRQWKEVIRRARKHGKAKGPKINRARVNRALKHQGKWTGKTVTKQLNIVAEALRKHGLSVEGWPPHQHSVWRAIAKFQKHQGWHGDDADGLLGPTTCKRLGIRSRWARLPEWGKKKKH